MKGYRFLKDGDLFRSGDEMQLIGGREWEQIGDHMIGTPYSRKFHILTVRRKAQVKP
jgi:hypothetical protein